MNDPNPFDSPHGQPTEPEPKKWWQPTVVEWFVIAGIILVLVGLLLPSRTHSYGGGRRSWTSNNLKNIGLALHNYHDTYGSLPPVVVTDSEGRPLYSWRVLLLPFLEQKGLYDQFDLSLPWDSETNRPLAEMVPSLFESPYLDTETYPGMTTYLAVVDSQGKQTIMLPQEGRSFDEVPCELGRVAMVVERIEHPVIWTKPGDITPFELIDAAKIEQNDLSYFPVLLGDGAVQWMPKDDPKQLKECLLCPELGGAEQATARE
ncbi:hypothetical protein C5Y96_13285 [Blastopirellula marina]|uniref:DUF1559 domain-containing protein n=1 Tax=Blastopirellula marina TaxID=124 RepID=A0A2S8FGL4_9BACT|nr:MULTISPECIES: DUF1559 domain-containing protein [Pirellulaceae]PQO31309.1 hypothetical protein C5Y96_13285 [Blastopirellula marina]RCS51703.1 DUF1559 domain-containing protein [Bremerella cremea]